MNDVVVPKHVIYDWETTDNKPTSAVASIAAIVFVPGEMKTFDELVASAIRIKFDLSEQFAAGRTWSQDVIDFWKKPENQEAYDMVIKEDGSEISLSQFGPIFQKWLNDQGYVPNIGEKIWTRGNAFDPPIFTNIYQYFGWDEPFPWWNIRDVRTEVDAIVPYWDPQHEGRGYIRDFPYPENFVKHKEEHDCARDILMMQYAHVGMINYLNSLRGIGDGIR